MKNSSYTKSNSTDFIFINKTDRDCYNNKKILK